MNDPPITGDIELGSPAVTPMTDFVSPSPTARSVADRRTGAGHTVVPRCKLTGDDVFRHRQYQDLVSDEYQVLVLPISRPQGEAPAEDGT